MPSSSSGFQDMYFENSFPPEFEVTPKPEYQNRPRLLTPKTDKPGGEDRGPGRADRRPAGVDAQGRAVRRGMKLVLVPKQELGNEPEQGEPR